MPSSLSPHIHAFPQRLAPVCSHLLAAVPLADRKDHYLFDEKSQTFRDLRQDNVHRNGRTSITHVVINHYQGSARLQHASAFGDDTRHFIEVAANHSRNAVVVEETGIHQKPPLSKTENLDLSQQIAEKVIWSIRNKEEKIRLTLDPPQLGTLFIELRRDKEEIKATLWADNPKTKEILENNQFQLQKTLEADGFKLGKYEVFVQKDMGSFQGNAENPIFHGQRSRKQSLGIEEAELAQPLEILPGVIHVAGGSQYIDRFI